MALPTFTADASLYATSQPPPSSPRQSAEVRHYHCVATVQKFRAAVRRRRSILRSRVDVYGVLRGQAFACRTAAPLAASRDAVADPVLESFSSSS